MLNEWLIERGFGERYEVAGRTSIAFLFDTLSTCGIYFLHFANEEYYVGLAKDVVRRYGQHRRTYVDIVHLSFKPVEAAQLKQVESADIDFFKSRVRLRNIDEMEDLIMERDVDKLVPPEVAERFLKDAAYNDFTGEKYRNDELQTKYKYRQLFQHLKQQPFYTALLTAVREYVLVGIPAPVKTEYTFWSVTCFPLRPEREDSIVLRLNIYRQEVFTVYVMSLANGRKLLEYVFHLAKSPFQELTNGKSGLNKLQKRCPSLVFDDNYYPTGGKDQCRLSVQGLDVLRLLYSPACIQAIRLHNLRLMRKGANMNRVSHCMDLVEQLLKFT